MRAEIFKIVDTPLEEMGAELTLSPFIRYLENRVSEETTVKKGFFEYVLNKLKANEGLAGQIDLGNIGLFSEELGLLYSLLVAPVADEQHTYWALTLPMAPVVFYGTDAFFNLIEQKTVKDIKNAAPGSDHTKDKSEVYYSLVLERLYGFEPIRRNNLVYSFINPRTGLKGYYRLQIDNQFLDVFPREELPVLDFNQIRETMTVGAGVEMLYKVLPLERFRFEGFSMMTVTDVTTEQALEEIKNLIFNRASYKEHDYKVSLTQLLKMLAGNPDLNFCVLPLIKIDNKFVFDIDQSYDSFIIDFLVKKDLTGARIRRLAQRYLENPVLLYSGGEGSFLSGEFDLLKELQELGTASYAIIPIHFNKQIVGILEVYSQKKNMVNENLLAKLEATSHLLALFLKDYNDDLNNEIENVIKEQFTSLQASVQWKFKQVSWQYLRGLRQNGTAPDIGNVRFENVYPLYGAADIRNSTIERNSALAADLKTQFKSLIETLEQLESNKHLPLVNKILFQCRSYLDLLESGLSDDLQLKVKDFLEVEIHSYLQHFMEVSETDRLIAERYYKAIDTETGIAFSHRRSLELSMQIVNNTINNSLEDLNEQIRQTYPSYFEKFRTDGVEYDIYIGQSIAPDKPFNLLYLKNIRLLQLKAMADIARLTYNLQSEMPVALQTTQLIYINSGTIDISFRRDEHRFDVEGAYNIRYQVIKKRIDKVHIMNSGERLTQPGKIAMVYFSSREADEYKSYISYLQDLNVLDISLEELELEELQGVSGLRALRVGVVLN